MNETILIIFSIYGIIAALIIFILFFSDIHNQGIVGVLSRFFIITIPNSISSFIILIIGQKGYEYLYSYYDYTVNKRNPLLQIAYLTLINGAYVTWLLTGQPLLPTYLIPAYHSYIVFFGVVLCQGLFFISCSTSPGVITLESQHKFDHQDYDGTVFVEGKCQTCGTKKIPRSKHCSLCGICVPVFDHHCVWLNQCVGQNNYRFFLLFLFVHVIFFFYSTYVSGGVMLSKAFELDLFNAKFVNRRTGKVSSASWYLVVKYILYSNVGVLVVFSLVSVMGFALLAFLGYHLYLVSQGTTTNETYKWKDANRAYSHLKQLYENYQQIKEENPQPIVQKNEVENKDDENKQKIVKDVVLIEMTPTGMLLRGLLDLRTPSEGGQGIPDPGHPPINIYNKGFFTNLWSIMFPKSLNNEKIEKIEKVEKEITKKSKQNNKNHENIQNNEKKKEDNPQKVENDKIQTKEKNNKTKNNNNNNNEKNNEKKKNKNKNI